jgi:hypothetical protein
MSATALYYTFSTIAQALAGAFGVLAAFAVLALTRIEADIRDGQEAMSQLKSPGSDELWDKAVESGVGQFGGFVKKEFPQLNDADVASDPRWPRVRRGVEAVPQQRSLRGDLIGASVPTGVDIGLSLVLIPFVPALSCSMAWSVFFTTVTILLALVSLWFYGKVVLGTIREET